jgi:predicted extracellular nuclease
VIAEVYGGGGNTGATWTNGFIELGNRGTAGVSLDGWSVQYLPANALATSPWQVTALSGTLAAGRRYLVQEAAGTGGSTPLPTPDTTGTIAMSATGATVALVRSTTALTADVLSPSPIACSRLITPACRRSRPSTPDRSMIAGSHEPLAILSWRFGHPTIDDLSG